MDQKNKRLEAIFIAILKNYTVWNMQQFITRCYIKWIALYVENETEQYHLQKRGQQLNVDNEWWQC